MQLVNTLDQINACQLLRFFLCRLAFSYKSIPNCLMVNCRQMLDGFPARMSQAEGFVVNEAGRIAQTQKPDHHIDQPGICDIPD